MGAGAFAAGGLGRMFAGKLMNAALGTSGGGDEGGGQDILGGPIANPSANDGYTPPPSIGVSAGQNIGAAAGANVGGGSTAFQQVLPSEAEAAARNSKLLTALNYGVGPVDIPASPSKLDELIARARTNPTTIPVPPGMPARPRRNMGYA